MALSRQERIAAALDKILTSHSPDRPELSHLFGNLLNYREVMWRIFGAEQADAHGDLLGLISILAGITDHQRSKYIYGRHGITAEQKHRLAMLLAATDIPLPDDTQ